MAVVAIAAAYVGVFHFSLGRVGTRNLPRPHGHVAAQFLLIGSYLVLLNFAADVLVGSFPNSPTARALKQAITD